jgi:hypothetical protein
MRVPSRPGSAHLAVAMLLLAAIALATPHGNARAAKPDISPYRGSAGWIDIYDGPILRDPLTAIANLQSRDVGTLFLETANYRQPAGVSIVYPVATAQLIDAAHASGIKVVAWYLPSFAGPRRDLRRSLDAIRFTTPLGGHFDSFALDIEANTVKSIALRNARVQKLSRSIRKAVGRRYSLGAIVPDQRSTTASLPSLWPHFPYRRLRPYYDVFLPMSYSSFRGKGADFVYGYTRANVAYLRSATGDPALPVHVIGGLANKLGASEAQAVIDGARDEAAIGASFYKLRLSGPEDWSALTSTR